MTNKSTSANAEGELEKERSLSKLREKKPPVHFFASLLFVDKQIAAVSNGPCFFEFFRNAPTTECQTAAALGAAQTRQTADCLYASDLYRSNQDVQAALIISRSSTANNCVERLTTSLGCGGRGIRAVRRWSHCVPVHAHTPTHGAQNAQSVTHSTVANKHRQIRRRHGLSRTAHR